MNRDDVIRMAREADREWDCDRSMVEWLVEFAALVAAAEREFIAQIIEDSPPLVDFVTNEHGGCILCGFTPELAAFTIRATGQE